MFCRAAAFMQACTCFPEQLMSGVLQAPFREAKAQALRFLLLLRCLCRGSCNMRGSRARRPAPRSKAVHARRLPALSRPQAHLKAAGSCAGQVCSEKRLAQEGQKPQQLRRKRYSYLSVGA